MLIPEQMDVKSVAVENYIMRLYNIVCWYIPHSLQQLMVRLARVKVATTEMNM